MAKKEKKFNTRRQAGGCLLLLASIMFLLSVVSYDKGDVVLFQSPPNEPAVNFIGPVGAWTVTSVTQLFGVGGYLFPVLLAAWGLILITRSTERSWPRAIWLFVMLLMLCILSELGTWQGMCAHLNIGSPGAIFGHWIGARFLFMYLGHVGGGLLCIGVFLVGLFFVTQTHPLVVWHWCVERAAIWRERRETARDERTAQTELTAREQRKLEKEQARLAKQLAKEERDREREEKAREKERIRQEEEETARRQEEEEKAKKAAFLQRLMEQKKAEEAKKAAEAQAIKEAKEAETKAKAAAEAALLEVEDGMDAAAEAARVWQLPPQSLLQPIPEGAGHYGGSPDDFKETVQLMQETLAHFNIEAEVVHVERGPTVTQYELLPAPGVKVERIGALSNNLTLALKAESIRVQAPIPGKGVVGIEVPNKNQATVVMRELLESAPWITSKAALPLALGKDVGGHVLMGDLASMPHILIAGATGQGKTVCMNTLLAGLLMTRTPDDLRLMLIDPKSVEFVAYNGLPHLLLPVITDAKKVTIGLRWAIVEMEKRFKLFQKALVRDIKGYNSRPIEKQTELFEEDSTDEGDGADAKEPPMPDRLPYIVIIIDELADLMLTAQQDIEPQIQKLTQLARATGIHLVLATQRPTVDIITGTIKSNVPGRIAFKVAQKNDSRVIIDQEGADKLIGKGDMLVLLPGVNKLVRAQGAWTKDEEIYAIAEFWKQQGEPRFEPALKDRVEGKTVDLPAVAEEDEEVMQQALEVIRQTRRASTSSIQRRLRIGYTRAARLMDILEEKGYVGPPRGSEPREILFDLDDAADDYGDESDDDGSLR